MPKFVSFVNVITIIIIFLIFNVLLHSFLIEFFFFLHTVLSSMYSYPIVMIFTENNLINGCDQNRYYTPGHSVPGSNGNDEVLYTYRSSCTEASPEDV